MSSINTTIKRLFLPAEGNRLQQTYFWNFAAGALYSGSSFIMLMAVTQFLDSYWGGVFSIGLAISQQLITIGYFCVRNYQVSDTGEAFSSSEYITSRVITSSLMLIVGVIWVAVAGFSYDKTFAILAFTVLKAAESFSNVLEGRYQQQQRLDAACRGVFAKTLVSMICFIVVLGMTSNLGAALAADAATYLFLIVVIDRPLIREFGGFHLKFDCKRQTALLCACFPMFVNSFMTMYINNAPKYSINASLSEELLACYSALFMISFVIAVFGDFIINPVVADIALKYNAGDDRGVLRIVRHQMLFISGFSVPALAGAYYIGIPVLSACYGLDLSPYRFELCLLLLGGVLLAVYRITNLLIIVMRHQICCLVGVLITAAVAFTITPPLVRDHSITGGAWSYFIAMAVMLLASATQCIYFYRRDFAIRDKEKTNGAD